MATVLFRRYSVRHPHGDGEPLFAHLTQEQGEHCKSILIAAFSSEQPDSLRHKVEIYRST
jgi:hypothetical protein